MAGLLLLEVREERTEAGWLGGPQFQARSFLQVTSRRTCTCWEIPGKAQLVIIVIPRPRRKRRMELQLREHVSSLRARKYAEYNIATK